MVRNKFNDFIVLIPDPHFVDQCGSLPEMQGVIFNIMQNAMVVQGMAAGRKI